MDVQVIRDDDELRKVEAEIYRLMEAKPELGSRDGDRLEALSVLAEAYENEHYPIALPDPVAAIWERLIDQDAKMSDMFAAIGKVETALILSRRVGMTRAQIERLAPVLGLSIEVLEQPYAILPDDEVMQASAA